jgi:hypothetical protein
LTIYNGEIIGRDAGNDFGTGGGILNLGGNLTGDYYLITDNSCTEIGYGAGICNVEKH